MYFLFSDRDLKPENILLDHKVSDLCVLYNVVGKHWYKALKLAKKDSFYIRFYAYHWACQQISLSSYES